MSTYYYYIPAVNAYHVFPLVIVQLSNVLQDSSKLTTPCISTEGPGGLLSDIEAISSRTLAGIPVQSIKSLKNTWSHKLQLLVLYVHVLVPNSM